MKNIIRNIFLIVLILTPLVPVFSQATDSGGESATSLWHPEIRQMDSGQIEKYKLDEDFNYLDKASPGQSIWERFWLWVRGMLRKIFGSVNPTGLGNLIELTIYIVIIAIIGFAVYRLTMIRMDQAFNRGNKSDSVEAKISEENIHDLPFDDLIRNALNNHNYRLAIRLKYLQSLKLLADKEVIHWEPYKTNLEYRYEITSPAVQQAFDRISYYFDYAWYGEFAVEEHHFESVGEIYSQMKQGL